MALDTDKDYEGLKPWGSLAWQLMSQRPRFESQVGWGIKIHSQVIISLVVREVAVPPVTADKLWHIDKSQIICISCLEKKKRIMKHRKNIIIYAITFKSPNEWIHYMHITWPTWQLEKHHNTVSATNGISVLPLFRWAFLHMPLILTLFLLGLLPRKD